MSSSSGVVSTAKAVKNEFSGKNVTFMAGSIAYNAFVSLVPLLVLLLLAATVFGGGELDRRILALIEQNAPGAVASIVNTMLKSSGGAAGAGAVGLVTLVWGTLKIFRGLDTAFSEIYETVNENTFTEQIKDGLVVLVALVVAIVGTAAITAVFGVFSDTVPFLGFATPLVLVVGLVVAFLPMYYFFPDADVEVREVLPGTVFAAVGWAALQAVFQIYLSTTGKTDPSDVLSGIVILLTWLYFSGIILLLGAVVNAVIGDHSSGAAGGVGADSGFEESVGPDRRRDVRFTAGEAAPYLARLREDLTGRYEGMRPTTDGGQARPRPAGEIALAEGAAEKADDEDEDGAERPHWEIRIRYPYTPDEGLRDGEDEGDGGARPDGGTRADGPGREE
ncbi:YihY/virulence factor BrkB family protein [Halobium salinum]|uniref:YihY/virulence factor BrkB family protein n=1 Tax=Halobium salinum TaxID=1364940 RepID=A0ABD5PE21_9EURY|nr:YihY/virulence factor BrkB family protein [Halobium salinum]